MIRSPASLALASLLVSLASPSGCNTPPKKAHDAPIVTAPAPASASPSASASASPSASPSASCTKDDDCRLFSSYCQEAPCACRALSARDPSPTCLGGAASNVRCFADPCMKKAAQCQGGTCVVTAK